MKKTRGTDFRFCPGGTAVSLLLSFWVSALSSAQVTPDLRPGEIQSYSQRVSGAGGTSLSLETSQLPERRTATFEIPGLSSEAVLPAGQAASLQASLLARITKAQSVVAAAIMGENGGPKSSVEDILAALDAARLQATGDLRTDLENLLIAATSRVEYPIAGEGTRKALFKVWSYRLPGERDPATARLCGPRIVARPGTVLFIPVLNLLEKNDLSINGFPVVDDLSFRDDAVNSPHGFDVINLHTHGLNVSPMWPADDVFREIHPFQLKFFIYEIPPDHPVGTFWYHPHKHGAVSAHVSGGMAGPLIVAGEPGTPLGLDKIGVEKGWIETDEPLLLQQITQYTAKADIAADPLPLIARPDFIAVKSIRALANGDKLEGKWQSLGNLVTWMKQNLDNIAPSTQTWLSGRLNPNLRTHAGGETFRLRLIHAGIGQNWGFDVCPSGSPAATVGTARIQVIAWDGIPLEEPYELRVNAGTRDLLTLAPGNRADILVWFPPGSPADCSVVARYPTGPVEIGLFKITAGSDAEAAFLTKEDVVGILKPVPQPTASIVAFSGTGSPMSVKNSSPPELLPGKFEINGLPYPGDPLVFNLNENSGIRFEPFGHPIHIHVNPVLIDAGAHRKEVGMPASRYWTDTMLNLNPGETGAGVETGIMPFDHWIGKSVVHCHILDHEDNGMMNVLEIKNRNGPPPTPVLDYLGMTSIPEAAVGAMKPAWPTSATQTVSANLPILYIFLPRPADITSCPHCTTAVISIAALRKTQGVPDFRIAAVTGPNVADIPELAAAMHLDPARDILCADADLKIFQALGLVDGTPEYSETAKQFFFPRSFGKDGKLIHDSDLMHGVFVTSSSGFIVSSYRSFLAYDDNAQILRDIKIAADPAKGIAETVPAGSPGTQVFKKTPLDLGNEKSALRLQMRWNAFTKEDR